MFKYYRQKTVEWPANLAMFVCFRPISLKMFNSLTSIDVFSCLCGPEVTHQSAVPEVPGLIRAMMFMVAFVCVGVVEFLLYCPKHLLSIVFASPFAMFINYVYLTYCTICDR